MWARAPAKMAAQDASYIRAGSYKEFANQVSTYLRLEDGRACRRGRRAIDQVFVRKGCADSYQILLEISDTKTSGAQRCYRAKGSLVFLRWKLPREIQ